MDMNFNRGAAQAAPRSRKPMWIVGVVLVILVALLIAAAAIYKLKHKLEGKAAVSGEYQAVFLSNGQVYFGKLDLGGKWAKLTDIYYLQVTEPLQNASSGSQNTNTTPNTNNSNNNNIQLVKLGSELHGPQDVMYIETNNILFWENMKDDSKVLQSIRQYKDR